MKKQYTLLVVFTLIIALIAGCAQTPSAPTDEQPSSDKVIRIGVFQPVTGENGGGGFQEVLGIRYARESSPRSTLTEKRMP